MNVLVLGGDGFLGSYFVDHVLDLGHDVTVFDRFQHMKSNNLEHLREKVQFISGDFKNPENLSNAIEDHEVVCHFVSKTNPVLTWSEPYMEIEENLKSAIQFCELAGSQNVKKIVFPSSGGTIYGSQREAVDENAATNPITPHGIAKLATEHFLHYLKRRFNFVVDIYRIGNLYGPRQPIQNRQGVIAIWMRDILNGSEIQIYGDHTTVRDYIYVEDAAFLMTNSLLDVESSDTYNLGSGIGTSILDLLEIFKKVIQRPIRYRIHPIRPSDNSSIILNSSKLLRRFPGFVFQQLERKIEETWNIFKSQYENKVN